MEVNEDNCVTPEGVDMCEALAMEQVAAEGIATGSSVELMTRGGDPLNTFVGEGELVQAGDQFDVVCVTEDDYGRTTVGVLLPPEFDLGHVDADAWAPGKVEGANLVPVAFLVGDGIDDVETVKETLGSQLADQFVELDPRNSCEDHRVVWDSLDRVAILAAS
ncbi:MAG: hypothetical protein L0H93_07250 [Nocardioides sp.]|nr:hypothetical protein [Nocardioides sp.]